MPKKYILGLGLFVVVVITLVTVLTSIGVYNKYPNSNSKIELTSIERGQDLSEYFEDNGLSIYDGAKSIINEIDREDPLDLVTKKSWTVDQLGDFMDLIVWIDNYGDSNKSELVTIKEYVQKNVYRENSGQASILDIMNIKSFAQDLCDADPSNFIRSADGSCYQVITFDLEGTPPDSNYIYIDNRYEGDRVELSLSIEKTIKEADQKYRSIGYEQKPLVIWINDDASSDVDEGFETWMDAAYIQDKDKCYINIYPFATEALNSFELPFFRQTLAHELFHCIQGIYYPEQESVTWPIADWWGEGSAEFFSDWVYPSFDNENGFNADLDNNSQDNSVLKMSYENYVLFQSINNQLGIESVKDFLDEVSTSSNISDHLLKLSKYPGIDSLFEKTVQNYITNMHKDTGGGFKIFNPPYNVDSVHTILDIGEAEYESDSFEYGRGQLTILPTTYDRDINIENVSGEGRIKFYDRDKEIWLDEPEINKIEDCNEDSFDVDKNYLVSVVNTSGDNQKFVSKVNVTSETAPIRKPIDEKLVGVWQDNSNSFAQYLDSIYEEVRVLAAENGFVTDAALRDRTGFGCFFSDNTFLYRGTTSLEFSGAGAVGGGFQVGKFVYSGYSEIRGTYSAEDGQISFGEKEILTGGQYRILAPGFGIDEVSEVEPSTELILEPETVPYSIQGDRLETSISAYGQTHNFVVDKVD